MKLLDILPLNKWAELQKEIYDRSGLDAYVYDTEGMSITEFKKWANRLCPAIKANSKGLAFICAVANQNLAKEAMQKRGPVIGECDAGLLKLAIPIFLDDEFLGVAGGCGLILDNSEIESFLINKITDIDETEIEHLSNDIDEMTTNKVKALTEYIQWRLDKVVRSFQKESQQIQCA